MTIEASEQKNKKDVYIVTGGFLTTELISEIDFKNTIIIGVDRGAEWLSQNNIFPDYYVGDFDSVNNNFLDSIRDKYPNKIHNSPAEKDETDTELAMRLAISFEPRQITIIGGVGTRVDHVLANIHILLQAEKKLITATISDLNNRIQLLLPGKIKKLVLSDFKYVSLIPFTEKVEGINLIGFKYPLNDASMEIGTPFGISNELIKTSGTISIEDGILIIIESKD